MRGGLPARTLRLGRTMRNVQRLVTAEVASPMRVSLGKRLWSWRRGFLSRSAVRYGLTDDNIHLFVSDWARYVKTPRIDGDFTSALNNKIVFSRILASYGCTVPEYYCLIRDGEMFQIGDRYQMRSPSDVVDACLAGGEFIVKPYTGGGGLRVTALSASDGELLVNWQRREKDEVSALIARLSDGVISQFVRQHEYASRIFPHSTNSIRVLTVWDYERGEPFIPFAGHRFGRPSSIPVDNCSRGGMSCPVDVATGVLGVASAGYSMDAMSRHETHPDTGERITGLKIPHWEEATARLVEICREMAYIPYVGWDVVITQDGFAVTEGNSCPDLGHQTFGPLLEDPRVRAFFERFRAL
ncbi:MAG: sugar-transfer associated ATP-grasp domain-containing protein [Candidatus Eisenbacteria bacterium]